MKRKTVIDKSKEYIKETPYPNPNIFTKWFFKDNLSHAWCGAFVDYIFKHDLGITWLDSCKNFGYVPEIVNWAKNKEYWDIDYKNAKQGDLVVFNFELSKPNHLSHVAIIDSINRNKIISIDGNTTNKNNKSNCVLKKERDVKYIVGVIKLPYEEDVMPFSVGDYVIALEDIKLYTTIEYKKNEYTLKKGESAYVRCIKGNNLALADPITKEYWKSAWTNEINKLSKEIDYKKLYLDEVNKNKILQDKINDAINILK